MKELPQHEKPREKAVQFGLRSLSNRELIALILRNGTEGKSALELADQVLNECHGIAGLARSSVPQLCEIHGIHHAKAIELLACFEISRRAAYETIVGENVITHPKDLVNWLQKEIGSQWQENFLVIYLNGQGCILTYRILFVGTLNNSVVYPREIFKEALLLSSTSILMVHNHPSGSLVPSDADRAITKRLSDVGKLMEIEVVDHIIVTNQDYFSFRKAGMMD